MENIYSGPARLRTALYDAIAASQADKLADLREKALATVTAKAEASEANKASKVIAGTAWAIVAEVTEAALNNPAGAELDGASVADVVRGLILNALDNEPAAVKTVKAYTGLAARVAVAVRDNGKAFSTLARNPDDSIKNHALVREALASGEWKEISEAAEEVAKMVAEIRGRENDKLAGAARLAMLRECKAALQAIRDGAVRERDAIKAGSKAAKAASDLRQEAPANAAMLETVQAA